LRGHYYLLRQQHLFLEHFGNRLAPMPAFFPEPPIVSLDDTQSVRWSVRSDGVSGFVFFNNHQRHQQLPPKVGVQFALRTRGGEVLLPQQPVTLPSGSYGLWPFNMDCAGVRLDYATAQPLCSTEHDRAQWFFFAAIDGIAPEFAFNGKPPRPCRPGPEVAFTLKSPRGGKVHFVVLDASQGARLARLQIAGRPFLTLSPNALLPGANASLSLETLGNETMGLALFPAPREVGLLGKTLGSRSLGVFTSVKLPKLAPSVQPMDAADLRPAQITPQPLSAMQDSAWKSAAVWRISVLPADRNTVLRLVYVGDVIRIYAGGKLVLDQFYHGQPLDLPLWRIPPADLGRLEVQIMPLHKGFSGRLPNGASPDFGETISQANLLQASLLDRRQMDLTILP
jgi:hypothetical protein